MKLYEPNLSESQTRHLKWSDFVDETGIPTNKPILIETEDKQTKQKSQFVLLGALNEKFHQNNTVLRFSQLGANMVRQRTRQKDNDIPVQIDMF